MCIHTFIHTHIHTYPHIHIHTHTQDSDVEWSKPNEDEIGDAAQRNILWLYNQNLNKNTYTSTVTTNEYTILVVLNTHSDSELGKSLVFDGQHDLGTVWEGDFGIVLADILYMNGLEGFNLHTTACDTALDSDSESIDQVEKFHRSTDCDTSIDSDSASMDQIEKFHHASSVDARGDSSSESGKEMDKWECRDTLISESEYKREMGQDSGSESIKEMDKWECSDTNMISESEYKREMGQESESEFKVVQSTHTAQHMLFVTPYSCATVEATLRDV